MSTVLQEPRYKLEPPRPQIPSSAPDDVYNAIDEVLKTTRAIWNSQDFHRLKYVRMMRRSLVRDDFEAFRDGLND